MFFYIFIIFHIRFCSVLFTKLILIVNHVYYYAYYRYAKKIFVNIYIYAFILSKTAKYGKEKAKEKLKLCISYSHALKL